MGRHQTGIRHQECRNSAATSEVKVICTMYHTENVLGDFLEGKKPE